MGIAFTVTAVAPLVAYGTSDFFEVPMAVEGVDAVVPVDEGLEAFEAVQTAVELVEGVNVLEYLGIFL